MPFKPTVVAVVSVAALLFAPCARAADSLLDTYNDNVHSGLGLCGAKFRLAQVQADAEELGINQERTDDSDWSGCIAKWKVQIRKGFEAASKTVKKPAAKAALKEHYVLASVALSGIAPVSQETRGSYAQRQRDALSKVSGQWARFEAEQ